MSDPIELAALQTEDFLASLSPREFAQYLADQGLIRTTEIDQTERDFTPSEG